ncbi:MAG: uroporphyrinogen-III synthase [Acidimicrobiia bacterium]
MAVTAPAPGAGRLADEVRRRGHHPVLLPTVAIVPAEAAVLARARAEAVAADLVVLTSARTVDVVWAGRGMDGLAVAAVGPATAAATEAAGATVVVVGGVGGTALVEAIGNRARGRLVAIPHAEGTDLVPFAGLGAARIDATPVYAARPGPPGSDPVDAVLFASPSAVAGWVAARPVDGLVVGVIGPTTARAAREAGARPVVAATPSFADLAATLPAPEGP